MLIKYSLISTFNIAMSAIMILFRLMLILIIVSCDDAEYDLDNIYDPENMDLEPPALFFHPYEIDAQIDDIIQVELYGLQLDSAAAAHLQVIYERERLEYDRLEPGPFFNGDNDPIGIVVDDIQDGTLDIFIYYLPDMNSNQNDGGTWSIATISFRAKSGGEVELRYGIETKLRDANNNPVIIRDLGTGWVNIE